MSKRLLSLAGEETWQAISTEHSTALQRTLRAKMKDMAGLQAENAHKEPEKRADMAGHVLGSTSSAKGKAGGGSVALPLLLNPDMARHFVVRREATHLR